MHCCVSSINYANMRIIIKWILFVIAESERGREGGWREKGEGREEEEEENYSKWIEMNGNPVSRVQPHSYTYNMQVSAFRFPNDAVTNIFTEMIIHVPCAHFIATNEINNKLYKIHTY